MTGRNFTLLRRCLLTFAWVLLLISSSQVGAQSKSPGRAPAYDATLLTRPVELGAVGVAIGGDNPAYAQADFDDSNWFLVDAKRTNSEIFHHTTPEIVWQRISVQVSPTAKGLAIEAYGIAPAFELYVNGQKLAESGRVIPFRPYSEGARLVLRVPDAQIATGFLVIAIREHSRPSWWRSSEAGFPAEMITLGEESALRNQVWIKVIGKNALDWIGDLTEFGVSLVVFALFLAQRRQREYLWFSLAGLSGAIQLCIHVPRSFENIPIFWSYVDQFLNYASGACIILVAFAFVDRKLNTWQRVLFALICASPILAAWFYVHGDLRTIYVPIFGIPYQLMLGIGVPLLLVRDMRRGNKDAGILLIPILLFSLLVYLDVAIIALKLIPPLRERAGHFEIRIFTLSAGPIDLSIGYLLPFLFYLSMVVILVRRSTNTSRQQAMLAGELVAAQQVQQVILPETIEPIPGFAIESVYQPAQQVGGDFFQVLPVQDGGLLLVLGDVAGKGLPAAMLVSVLIGAIRATAEYTREPAAMLASLNERLIGRTKGGFSTALAAYFHPDGNVTIANAGHLSPYLDGKEMVLPGALPLGIVSGGSYETRQFLLESGSRLTFYSDGVIEAQNPKGELFGFERGQAISIQPASAIVEAAKQFGQSDDITVVAITRNAAIANAA